MTTRTLRLPPPDTPFMEIHPCAGLANRLRAIASAMCAAQDIGRVLVIVWKQEPNIFTGTFRDLFDVNQLPSWVYVNDSDYVQSNYKQQQCLSPADWDRIKVTAATDPRIHVNLKSHGHFHQSDPERWIRNLRSLRPIPEIQSYLDSFFKPERYPGGKLPRFVGVHIRRTDNTKAVNASPLYAFQAEMDQYGGDTYFIVASDDMDERRLIEGRYIGRVLTFARHLTRGSRIGSVDALLDFLALSQCQEILGSYNSSFSEIAAMYGGCRLKVALAEAVPGAL